MRVVKQAIWEGNLLELVEQRCRSHPRMLEALKQMYTYSPWLEQCDPSSKSTLFYCGPESAKRPEVLRFNRQLERFTIEGSVLIRAYPTKRDSDYDNVLIFKPPFGSYPQELAEVYPFNAEVVRTPDFESLESAYLNTIRLVELNPGAKFTFLMQDKLEHPLVEKLSNMDNFTVISPQKE